MGNKKLYNHFKYIIEMKNFVYDVENNKTGVFGSSSSKMFTLVKNLNIFSYPGKTALGISRLNNVYLDIKEKIKKYKYEICVFVFGNVDGIMSQLFNIITKGKSETDWDELGKKYIEAIGTFKTKSYVCGVPPTNLTDETVQYIPIYLNMFPCEDYVDWVLKNKIKLKKYFNEEFINNCIKKFNMSIKKYCDNKNVTYVDVPKQMINKNGKLNKKFRQLNKYSPHVRWELHVKLLGFSVHDYTEHYDKIINETKNKDIKMSDVIDKNTCKTIGNDRLKSKNKKQIVTSKIFSLIPSKYQNIILSETD
jgi:hypothetical protein